MGNTTKIKLLSKYHEQAIDNLFCYSADILMTNPKLGCEEDWTEAKAEVLLLEEMIAEEKAKAAHEVQVQEQLKEFNIEKFSKTVKENLPLEFKNIDFREGSIANDFLRTIAYAFQQAVTSVQNRSIGLLARNFGENKVTRNGLLICGKKYFSNELINYIGETVVIRGDNSALHAFHKGSYIGKLEEQPL